MPPAPIFSNSIFSYDGDGKRVKSVITTNIGSTTSYFVGNYYQVENGVVTKYYYAGSQRVAMRKNGTLSFIIGDHLGSTSLITDSAGNVINETKYKAWGETRYSSGTEQTNYTYTGQYSYASDFGLHFYNARWYDSSLSRFAQADTMIASFQEYDRYAYVGNNPVRYTDPSGHFTCSQNRNSDDFCPPTGSGNKPTTDPAPTPISSNDPVTLTENGNFSGYDGKDMYELYEFYFNTQGWWHDEEFDPDGFFSITDFFVLVVFWEMSGIGDDGKDPTARDPYTIAIAEKVSYWCGQLSSSGTCSGISNNAILNYAATREVMWKRYNAYTNYLATGNLSQAGLGPLRGGVPIKDNAYSGQTPRTIVNNAISMMSPQGSLWDFGNVYDSHGNPFVLASKIKDYNTAPTGCLATTCVFWKSQDGQAYVMNSQQIECWRFGNC